jgi:hypothetical protein
MSFSVNPVIVTLEGAELVAVLPDGRTLADVDPVRLADLLRDEGITVDQVQMPDWREGDHAPFSGHKIALRARMLSGYTYSITSRPNNLGGGWRLRLLEDGDEVGGGIFPPVDEIEDHEEALQAAYDDAMGVALDWLDSCPSTGPAATWPGPSL